MYSTRGNKPIGQSTNPNGRLLLPSLITRPPTKPSVDASISFVAPQYACCMDGPMVLRDCSKGQSTGVKREASRRAHKILARETPAR